MLAEFPDISGRLFHSQRARPYNSILILSLLSATSVQNLFLTYNQREVIDDESVITTLFMGINLVTCNLQPENEAGGSAEFRRKVRSPEVLSVAMEQLLRIL